MKKYIEPKLEVISFDLADCTNFDLGGDNEITPGQLVSGAASKGRSTLDRD